MDNHRITVGIDVAKDFLDICILPSEKVLRVENSKHGFKKLLSTLEEYPDIYRIVVEHTGGYQREAVVFLQERGFPVSIINPSRARHFAKAFGQRAKTDAIDAEMLALFGRIQKPPVAEAENKAAIALRQLVNRRDQIVKMITAEKNRLEKKPCPEVGENIEYLIALLKKELDKIAVRIQNQIQSDAVLCRKNDILQSVKGVGQETAAVLLAELPELGKIGRQQIAAMAGIAPINRDSGTKKGHAYIQAGRKNVRCALYMPAIVAIRFNPVLRDYYTGLVVRGKPKKIAIVACMRKLLVHLNARLAKEA